MNGHTAKVLLVVLCCLLSASFGGVAATPDPKTTTVTPDQSSIGTISSAATQSEPQITEDNQTNDSTPNFTLPTAPPNARNWSPNNSSITTATTTEHTTKILVFNGTLTEPRRAALHNRSVAIGAVVDGRAVISGPSQSLQTLVSLPWVTGIEPPRQPHPVTVSEGVSSIRADILHSQNITGENVTVGVIDLGFDVSNPEIDDQIVAKRAFDGQAWGGAHGTAVTEVVTDVAPGADIAVAQISNVVEYERALQWLTETQDVDVITISLAFYGQPNDGTGRVSMVTTQAVESGTIVTVASGNDAQRHWEGEASDMDRDGRVEYTASGTQVNFLDPDTSTEGAVNLYLTWDEWPTTTQDYNLYLYRRTGDGAELVKASTYDQSGGGTPLEVIQTYVPSGRYFAVIEAESGTGTPSAELFCTGAGCGQQLSERTPEGSITSPAVAPGVLGVGAYNVDTNELEPYSSRGPDNDGDRGIDVLGPTRVSTTTYDTFAGTSAAAPHVGGIAALATAADPTASASTVADRIEQGADPIGTTAPSTAIGTGRASATGTIEAGLDPLNVSIETNATPPYRVGSPITFEATTGVQRPATIRWDLNGDGTADATGSRITHRFDETGSKTITVSATDGYGATASINRTLQLSSPSTLPTTLSLVANQQTISVTERMNVAIRYSDGFGIGEFNMTVTTPNTTSVEIDSVNSTSYSDLTVSQENDSVHIQGTANTTHPSRTTLAIVSITGTQSAENVRLQLTNATITTADGVRYQQIHRQNLSLSVASGPGDVTGNGDPATDPDGDGIYEDIDGNRIVDSRDILALWNLRDTIRVQYFDMDGTGTIDARDVLWLWNNRRDF